MTQSSRQDITFGVELEFLTPTGSQVGITTIYELAALTRKAVAEEIARLAEDIPLAVQCLAHENNCPTCIICNASPAADASPGILVLSKQRPSQPKEVHAMFRYFHVQKEVLSAANREGHWTGLEISTPVFGMSELEAGLPQVSKLIWALRKSQARILVNDSCGMHIHVGVKGGMRLAHAKKVATLGLLLDQTVLMKLLPFVRRQQFSAQSIGSSSKFGRRFSPGDVYEAMLAASCQPAMQEHLPSSWRDKKMASRGWNNNNGPHFQGTAKLIWSSNTLAELREGLALPSGARSGIALLLRGRGQGKSLPVDFGDSSSDEDPRLSMDFEGTPSTYEFRFPQMGFDTAFIKNWTELSCKIVELAMLPAPQFSALLERLTRVFEEIEDAKDEGLDKIWPVLSLQHKNSFWRRQLERRDEGHGISGVDQSGFLRSPEP